MPEKHVSFKNKKSKKPSKVSQVTDSLDLTWEGTRANKIYHEVFFAFQKSSLGLEHMTHITFLMG